MAHRDHPLAPPVGTSKIISDSIRPSQFSHNQTTIWITNIYGQSISSINKAVYTTPTSAFIVEVVVDMQSPLNLFAKNKQFV